jgi:DNA-binding GntR family transcriptional regulator
MSTTFADKTYQKIKHEIITWVLDPGQQIVQSMLAERHQVSMTPIREALQRLMQNGFVHPMPRSGYIVSPITVSDVKDLFELRAILEAAAVRLAAERCSQDQLDHIVKTADFQYIYKNQQSYTEFLGHNVNFHTSIALAAGNKRLADCISNVLDALMRVFHLGLDLKDSAEEMHQEHMDLVKALCARDPLLAKKTMQAQIERAQERMLKAILNHSPRGKTKTVNQSIQI